MVVNSSLVGLLWLSMVIPPLLTGAPPAGIDHYTTLIVQGLDLALFLPAGFLAGLLFWRRHPLGSLMTAVYLVFLCFLMTALMAKLLGMALVGTSIVPSIFLITPIWIFTFLCTGLMMKALGAQKHS